MGGSVSGYVLRTKDKQPCVGATVMLAGGPGPSPDIAPLTDSAGWFALDGLPEGECRLRAQGPEGEFGETTVTVFADAVTDATIFVAAAPEAAATQRSSGRTSRIRRRAKPDIVGAVEGSGVDAEGGRDEEGSP